MYEYMITQTREACQVKHGDLSNKVRPSLLIVFEGLIGVLPDENKAAFDKAVKHDRWWHAISYYTLDPQVMSKMLDLIWHKQMNLEIVTFLSENAAIAIAERMDQENIPVASVWDCTPDRLSRLLSYLPRIAKVYDPDKSRAFKYGSRGMYVTNHNQVGGEF